MPLSLKDIFIQAGKQDVALVQDGPIYYMVLNTKLNILSVKTFQKIFKVLESVEKSEGPAVLVTINSGDKVFSAGMDIKSWETNYFNQENNIICLHKLMQKVLTLSVPSLCVVNGVNIAGGVWTSLSHDRVIMADNPKLYTWLIEAEKGICPTFGMQQFMRETCTNHASRTLLLGEKIKPQLAKKLDIVQDLYKNE